MRWMFIVGTIWTVCVQLVIGLNDQLTNGEYAHGLPVLLLVLLISIGCICLYEPKKEKSRH